MHIQETYGFGQKESKDQSDHIFEDSGDQCEFQGIGDYLHIVFISGEYGPEVLEAYIVKFIGVCGPVRE